MAGIGTPSARLDGAAKVTGAADYGSDALISHSPPMACSRPAPSRAAASWRSMKALCRAVPGVIGIFTHKNIGAIARRQDLRWRRLYGHHHRADQFGDEIFNMKQPDRRPGGRRTSFETPGPGGGAPALRIVRYEARPSPAAGFGERRGSETVEAAKVSKKHEDPHVGDPEGAFAVAAVKLDQRYETATEHHNPLELFTTACAWEGSKLISVGIQPEHVGLQERFGGCSSVLKSRRTSK